MNNLPDVASAKLNELNRVRADLNQMEQELSKSHRMFSLATDRISEIGKFLSHSEVNLAALERLEPENSRLNAKVSDLRSEVAREKALISEAEARSIAVESKYADAQKANETYRQDALTQTEALRTSRQSADKMTREIREMTGAIEELKNKVDMERDNAAITAEKNARIVGEMSTMSRKNLELSKRVDEIHASNKRNGTQREAAQNELKSLRLEYASLRDTNIEKTSRLEALTHELSVKERSFDENIKYRENEVFGLQSTLEDFKVQLRIKEEVSRRSDRELIDLKSMITEESKRRRRLEKDADDLHGELAQNRDSLVTARQNFDDLNRRLIDAQAELRAIKVVNQQQSTKLEQYSAVGGVVVDFQEERSKKVDAAKAG
jgi:chromosome segregation ATPase